MGQGMQSIYESAISQIKGLLAPWLWGTPHPGLIPAGLPAEGLTLLFRLEPVPNGLPRDGSSAFLRLRPSFHSTQPWPHLGVWMPPPSRRIGGAHSISPSLVYESPGTWGASAETLSVPSRR